MLALRPDLLPRAAASLDTDYESIDYESCWTRTWRWPVTRQPDGHRLTEEECWDRFWDRVAYVLANVREREFSQPLPDPPLDTEGS